MDKFDYENCDICGDELCPGCGPVTSIRKQVFLTLIVLLGVASVWLVVDPLGSQEQSKQIVTASTESTLISNGNDTSTSIGPSEQLQPTDIAPNSTTSTVITIRNGPLDNPLLERRPAALWFWIPGCTLCQGQAEFVSRVAKVWAPYVNIVSIALSDEEVRNSEFRDKYGIDLTEISDKYGELSSFFQIGQTSDWGFIYPDGSYKTVSSLFSKEQLAQEFASLARSKPQAVIDTSNESEVRAAYLREFGQKAPPLKWTGSVGSCDPGTTSKLNKEATLSRVNWYRAMAGVNPTVILDDQFSELAQAAALTMYASGMLDHEPNASFRCYTKAAYEGASRSNLHLGYNGPMSIDSYIEDEGSNNEAVGHRRWILFPELVKIGTGDTKGSNALLVISDHKRENAKIRERGLVMWPPRGFVPRSTIYRRWSVSAESAFSQGAHVLVRTSTKTLFNDSVWPDDFLGWPTLVFSISPSLVGSEPIDVVISELKGTTGRGNLIVSYQVLPID
jgi:hypothetical protein